ncbi:HAMP domain-containing sensor histidine kinase [Virgisporangium ochraceum]|uniref:Signal transduction histidine-protein kinase/phosphatase MprB n=1 Tax=Virgisporangium ochraceum TaxID=65505 RepID=A0A8J3ZL36_9ACTN|nr:HAMP domain-containing sensor histidine kinase [Virgisporangium ochraceum]GIJ65864.1 two-component sensor histidine kinase [Virgisporangium ochraceum]
MTSPLTRVRDWWRWSSLRTRLSVMTATGIAVGSFAASVFAWQVLAYELRHSIEEQLRGDAAALLAVTDRDGAAAATLPSASDAGLSARILLPDGTVRSPVGLPIALPVTADALRVADGRAAGRFDLVEVDDGIDDDDNYFAYDDDVYLVYTVHTNGGAIQIARDGQFYGRAASSFALFLLLDAVVCAGSGVIVGRMVARTVLAPVDRLTATAVRVARTHNLDEAIAVRSGGEIGQLAQAINDMLAALDAARRSQRLLADDAAHELRTPLTSLRLNIELLIRLDRRGTLQTALDPAARAKLLDDLGVQVVELSTVVAELTDLARGDVATEPTEVVNLADQVVAAVTRARSRVPDVDLVLDLAPVPVPVTGRPAALQRAVLNLLDNAGKWSPPGQPVYVRLGVEGGAAVLEVDDGGPGIDAVDVPRVFDRSYRADAARDLPGSGLGLSIVRRVVDTHGGEVTVHRSDRGGALLRVRLPVASR